MTVKKRPEDLKKRGRKPIRIYSKELAQEICDDIASTHLTNAQVCKSKEHYPSLTKLYDWVSKYPEFEEMYRNAKAQQAECRLENVLDATYDDSKDFYQPKDGETRVNSNFAVRLKIRTALVQWMASKYRKDMYGDKTIESEDEVRRELDALKLVKEKRDALGEGTSNNGAND